MPATKPPYPPEFRREAVRLVRESGRPKCQIARELGITPWTLRLWEKQAEIDAGEREGLTSDEREELRRLRRENRVLQEEREISEEGSGFREAECDHDADDGEQRGAD